MILKHRNGLHHRPGSLVGINWILAAVMAVFANNVSVQGQNVVTPQVTAFLSSELSEASGLVNLEGAIWAHNDSGDDANLYLVDPSTGDILRTVEVTNAGNEDWEDIARDEDYVYIGDFGNNEGSRTDLVIYRVSIDEIADNDEVTADEIEFHYSDQVSFEPNYHNTNFDCEAMITYGEYLYLFTKNWIDSETNCYQLPKTPGAHEAILQSGFDVGYLVTGATRMPGDNAIVLIGYNTSGGTFTHVFRNFTGVDFFNGQQSTLIWTMLTQIEGVCPSDAQSIYICSEEFAGIFEPTLYWLELTEYLTSYSGKTSNPFQFHYNSGFLTFNSVTGKPLSGNLKVYSMHGQLLVQKQIIKQYSGTINTGSHKGMLLLVIQSEDGNYTHKFLVP